VNVYTCVCVCACVFVYVCMHVYLLLDMLRVDHTLPAGAVGGREGEVLHQSLDDYTHTHTYIYIYI